MDELEKIKARNIREGFKASVENVPRSAIERFHDAALFGGPITIISFLIVGVFLLQPMPSATQGFTPSHASLGNFLLIPATIALIPALAGLFAVAGMVLHPFFLRIEINHWARHGFYREGFEPHGFDMTHMREVSNETVKQHRRAKVLSR